MTECLTGFQEYLITQKAASKNTVQSYLRDIDHYLKYLLDQQIDSPDQATPQMVNDYISDLEQKGRSASTIIRNIASIRCFYQYLCSCDAAHQNPAQQIRREKGKRKLPSVLTGEELELLLAQPDIREIKGCRDKAMIELLYATGIRVSELIALNVADINFQEGILTCRGSKSTRRIPIYPRAVTAVSEYLLRGRSNERKGESHPEDCPLFVNLSGNRLSRQGFWKIIKGYATQAHITKEITPHTLRHSFALHLLENGAQLKDIQMMMGHVDISSTQLYVHILDDFYQESYYQFHPRAKKR